MKTEASSASDPASPRLWIWGLARMNDMQMTSSAPGPTVLSAPPGARNNGYPREDQVACLAIGLTLHGGMFALGFEG